MHSHAPCLLSVSLNRQWTALVRNARQPKFMCIPVYARVMHVDMTTQSMGKLQLRCSFLESIIVCLSHQSGLCTLHGVDDLIKAPFQA